MATLGLALGPRLGVPSAVVLCLWLHHLDLEDLRPALARDEEPVVDGVVRDAVQAVLVVFLV